MLIGTTGLSPPLGGSGCSVKDFGALQINAEFDFLYENLWLKTWQGKNDNEKNLYLHDTSTLPSRVHLPIYKTNLVAGSHTLVMI